jgi:hypothetical protein
MENEIDSVLNPLPQNLVDDDGEDDSPQEENAE